MTAPTPRRPWPVWLPQLARYSQGLAARPPAAPRPAPRWAVDQFGAFNRWKAWKQQGSPAPRPVGVWRQVPAWQSVGELDFTPWRLLEEVIDARPHEAFNPATLKRPPFVGPGIYVADEVDPANGPAAFEQLIARLEDARMKWCAMIPYYWTDGMVAELQERAPHVEPAPWLSWWGSKAWDDTRQDANGVAQAGVVHQLTRFRAKAYIGEVEQPGDQGTQFRTDYSHRNIGEQLALARPLDEHGFRRALVSDHCELIVDADGKLARGWDWHPECYADEVEYLAPGTGVNFRPSTQLRSLWRLIDPAHPVGIQPVRGYFAPLEGPWRKDARAWYAEDQQREQFAGWSGWREGSMTTDDDASLLA